MCSGDGCDRPPIGQGLCSKHYQRARKKGEWVKLPPKPDSCSIDGCENRRNIIRGLCSIHYGRLYRNGDPNILLRKPVPPECIVEGCVKKPHRAGRCPMHHHRNKTFGSTELPPPRLCDEDGCDEPHSARGLCRRHYVAAQKAGRFGGAPCAVPGCDRLARAHSLCGRHNDKRRLYPELTPRTLAYFDIERPCQICRIQTATAIDHDHDSGRVRGHLCGTCNTGIGHLRDNPAHLRAAADYLESTHVREAYWNSQA